jgi:hypothetical protein
MRHRLLAKALMVWVRYNNPEPAQQPDKFQSMFRDFWD